MALATENLYLGAYAMTNGARLHRVIVSRTDGRTTALFELDCAWSQKLVDEYYAGTATVNLADCSVSADKGAAELRTMWRDPTFNARQHAFYYVRVLENPSCRWSKANTSHRSTSISTARNLRCRSRRHRDCWMAH